jgi:thiamine biosynthesis lipoprotein
MGTSRNLLRDILAGSLFALLLACSPTPDVWHQELLVFGSSTQLTIAGASADAVAVSSAEIARRMALRNGEWHAWKPSDLSRINAAFAAGQTTPAPASIRTLIQRSQSLSAAVNGAFDPAIGGIIAAWGFHSSDYPIRSAPPAAVEIEQWLREKPSIADVAIHSDGSVSSVNRAVRLDFGAIAEGAASQEIRAILAEHGIHNALITMGGDVLAAGTNHGAAWRVGIIDPRGGIFAGILLADGDALFSSGDYNKYRTDIEHGTRLPHIINPLTGRPAQGTASTAVLHHDPVVADVAATTLMVVGHAGFESTLRALGIRCAMLLSDDDTLYITRAMRDRVELLRQPAQQTPALNLGDSCDMPEPSR